MLQKPYGISLKGLSIDANESTEISWKVSGDIQTAYEINIYRNDDNTLAWTSGRVDSYALKYVIPAGILTNGQEYKITITVYNQSDSFATSDADLFQTSSRPVVTISNIGTVATFSYNFTAEYFQANNVPLRSYIVYLFDDKKNLINKSDIKTSSPMQHLFSNLQTEKTYFIEFQATSTRGLIGTSGLIPFNVFYLQPQINIDLQGKNIPNAGVELSWFITQVIGSTDGSHFIGDDKIDTTDGTNVWFDSGFNITSDFSLKVRLENPLGKVDLITMRGDNGHTLTMYYDAVLERFVLKKNINGIIDVWVSDEVTGSSFVVIITQVGLNCSIEALSN